jgi:hypothetical protein
LRFWIRNNQEWQQQKSKREWHTASGGAESMSFIPMGGYK